MLHQLAKATWRIASSVLGICPGCGGPLNYIDIPKDWIPKGLSKPPHPRGRKFYCCPVCMPVTEGNMVSFARKAGLTYHRRS